jgi:cysteine desulfurase family protein (TIGR01976 family)
MNVAASEPKHLYSVAATVDIRAAFPALARVHHGQPVAYFDGPGGTQVPRIVVDSMADYLVSHNANTHWGFPSSAETDRALSDARCALADYINAAPDEIAFGANMTTLTFHVARALGRRLEPGDAVVVTELDHHANIDPWRELERERGVSILRVRFNAQTGELDFDDLLKCVTDPRTRILAIGAASNALGTINPVAAAIALAREAGAITFVDAVHFAPHELVDVRALGCDFLVCSAYKFYGPHVGVLFGRRERIEALEVPKLQPAPQAVPERLETGTQNHEGIVGAGAAVDFLASLATRHDGALTHSRRDQLRAVFEAFQHRGATLVRQLWDGLSEIDGVRLYGAGPDAPRTPTVAFTVAGTPASEVSQRLAERGIFASHGNFYAISVIERLGLRSDGLVRVGCACYTTSGEIDRVVAGVREIVGRA